MSSDSLATQLHRIDRSGYGAYKKVQGSHRLSPVLRLSIDKVQSDPFAPPSLIQAVVPVQATGIDPALLDEVGSIAVRDYLNRAVAQAINTHHARGDKASGSLSIDTPGQQVLERAAVVISGKDIHVRMEAAMPAKGRTVMGKAAARLLTELLPDVVDTALLNIDHDKLALAVELLRDQEDLRRQLTENEMIGFVAEGSILPRAAGNSDRPARNAVAFESPESMRTSFTLESGRTVTGMAVPRGVTLIVGGGYHGKSTLLRALERGVYNHVEGDGREFSLAVSDAASLRAEDGRCVHGVDISEFIGDIPSGTDTTRFSTTNASGSTSQAAGLVEALEAGASTLLIDEDTSATNFMIRDERMRQLVPSTKEPITPLVDRIRALWRDRGISTVLVAGGSGMFIDVADQVILLDEYRPADITDQARELSRPIDEQPEFAAVRQRCPKSVTFRKPPQAKGLHSIRAGKDADSYLDLAALTQLVENSQTNAIAFAINNALSDADGHTSTAELVEGALGQLRRRALGSRHPGRLAIPRRHEVVAALNRFRNLTVSH